MPSPPPRLPGKATGPSASDGGSAREPRQPNQALELPSFETRLGRPGLERQARIETVQINVGRLCNQACHHCHVDAGPGRRERMQRSTAECIVSLVEASPSVTTVDITGGAPELNDNFRYLVESARRLGRRVIDRCNLTVLFEPGMEWLAPFLAEHQVEVVCSLPCYTADNVDRQRGSGVFDKSIAALRLLNRLGYGRPGSPLALDLVYNPLGPSLPPPQPDLEQRYREELDRAFGITFRRLLTITNMPIKRFALQLKRDGSYEAYMGLLVNHFNRATVDGLMCRSLVSVGWDGRLYDCDFNQMLDIPIGAGAV
ncbi:MAG: radical SAM/Cys-rich domain protein, partial [Deltaproteobacteria bacterium]